MQQIQKCIFPLKTFNIFLSISFITFLYHVSCERFYDERTLYTIAISVNAAHPRSFFAWVSIWTTKSWFMNAGLSSHEKFYNHRYLSNRKGFSRKEWISVGDRTDEKLSRNDLNEYSTKKYTITYIFERINVSVFILDWCLFPSINIIFFFVARPKLSHPHPNVTGM